MKLNIVTLLLNLVLCSVFSNIYAQDESAGYCGDFSYLIRTGYEHHGATSAPIAGGLTDPNWSRVGYPSGCDQVPSLNPVVTGPPAGAVYIPEDVNNDGTFNDVKFLWPYSPYDICAGTFSYQTTFCLRPQSREGISNLTMDLKVMADNKAKVYLNGVLIAGHPNVFPALPDPPPLRDPAIIPGVSCFNGGYFPEYMINEVITDPALFWNGTNTLKVVWVNSDQGSSCDTSSFSPGWFSLYAKISGQGGCISNCAPEFSVIPLCTTCTSLFQDKPVGRYWMSAWVKVDVPSQVKTYEDGVNGAYITLDFFDIISSSLVAVNMYPTGEIIDGWQRIVGAFDIPVNAVDFAINLNADPDYNTYFDDIRIHPFNASMKSYVYDGETFWLTSELDDNNYATFYEYDEEGGLIRIKKETARGIVTIQETRSSTVKQ